MSKPARLLLVALGIGSLAYYSIQGLYPGRIGSSDEAVSVSKSIFEQLACIEDRIEASVPRGAKVFVLKPNDYWHQRVSELLYPRARVVESHLRADLLVGIEETQGPGECLGVQLQVIRPG